MGKKSKAVSVPMSKDEHVSICIRKIENGFIVSHSRSGPKGYESKETFHDKKPSIDVQSIANTGSKISEQSGATSKPDDAALRRAGGRRGAGDPKDT